MVVAVGLSKECRASISFIVSSTAESWACVMAGFLSVTSPAMLTVFGAEKVNFDAVIPCLLRGTTIGLVGDQTADFNVS